MQRIKVCVADDYVDEATILCEGLRHNNYNAIATHNGQDTLNVCCEGGVDILLLDVGLPDMDGYEVCRRLKADPATREIVVIFVTARGQATDIALGLELGAADYIPKPYNLPMVMVRVDSAARTRQHIGNFAVPADGLVDNCFTDELTGLRNRRYLLERLQEEVDKARRYKFPISCVVVDIEEVFPLDRDMGSAPVDDLLVEVGMDMRRLSRSFDIVARYDTFLFAAVLPHAGPEDAVGYATKIREAVSAAIFSDPPTQAQLAFGIVSSTNGSAKGAEHVLGEAMQGLLQAKSQANGIMMARQLSMA